MMRRSHTACRMLLSAKACCSIYLTAGNGLFSISKEKRTDQSEACLPNDNEIITYGSEL